MRLCGKLYRGAIPIDINVRKRGIALPSKCVCCAKPQEETMEHLLPHSDIARILWNHFEVKLQKRLHAQTINQLLRLWLHDAHQRSQLGVSILAVIFYGIWEMWKVRCKMKYEGDNFNANFLLRKVYTQAHDAILLHTPKRVASTFEKISLERMGFPIHQVRVKKGRWARLDKPEINAFKLNIDGSRKGQFSAGGGVIRDHQGHFVCGFSYPMRLRM